MLNKQSCEWVKCSDKLPTKEGSYLVYAKSRNPKKPFINIAWYSPETQSWELIPIPWANAITHWMPKPKPPKDDK